MEEKPKFKVNGTEGAEAAPSKTGQWKEVAAVWEKVGSDGSKYLSIKLTNKDGSTTSIRAFKNRFKEQNPNKPDYVAREQLEA
jgi:uncharacterized protein (DUF736 family)